MKRKSVINGWLNIYAQYGWQIVEPNGSMRPFDPRVASYVNKLGRRDVDGLLSIATFDRCGIEIYDIDDYGRTSEVMYRDYEVLIDAPKARV